MTRQTRRTIFYMLLGLFFVIGGIVVFYAEGWRVDLGGHFEKVGAIFVRSYPADATITLNNELIPNGSGLLSRGTLISNLFPRNYALTLKRDGFHDWRESAEVFPSLVTEFKYAVLVPQSSTRMAAGVSSFAISSNEIVLGQTSGAVTWRGAKIGSGTVLGASTDPKDVLVKTPAGSYLLYDFDTTSSTSLSAALDRNGIGSRYVDGVLIDPYDPTDIVVTTPGRVATFNTGTGIFTTIGRVGGSRSINPAIAVSPSFIAWTRFDNASGTSVAIYDKFSGTTATSTATVAGRAAELAWVDGNTLGVLEDTGSLYLYDTASRTFKKLADDAIVFRVAGDGSAIAALEHKSLEVLPLSDAATYHRFNIPRVADAKDLRWYKDANHLFIVYADRVSFLDLDDAGLNNFIAVANGAAPFYSPQTNALYLIAPDATLIRFDFPN